MENSPVLEKEQSSESFLQYADSKPVAFVTSTLARSPQERKKANAEVQTALSRPPVVEYWKGSDQVGTQLMLTIERSLASAPLTVFAFYSYRLGGCTRTLVFMKLVTVSNRRPVAASCWT